MSECISSLDVRFGIIYLKECDIRFTGEYFLCIKTISKII